MNGDGHRVLDEWRQAQAGGSEPGCVSVENEVLGLAECQRLLATVTIGRIVFTVGALPAVHPVNFIVDGGEILFRTDSATKLAAATRNAIVAFEVDAFDDASGEAWSVVVVGLAMQVHDTARILRAACHVHPWAGGPQMHVVSVRMDRVTGCRVGGGPDRHRATVDAAHPS